MADFNKRLAEESAAAAQSRDPSKELTEKEREEQAQKRADDNLRRLREFERHLKEAPKYHFNTNVFKKGVTFAASEVESGAIAKDEALVKELAAFVKDQALSKLIRDLQAVEGVPADSEAIEQAFHAHGLNMRYLGTVHEAIKEKELNHLKTLLEREAVVRSVKHLANMYLREVSDTHLSAVLAHLFNLIFAPFPHLARLEDNSTAYPASASTLTTT